MTEWLLRRAGGRAVGPVPTRALLRGIKQGKVPDDTEGCAVDGGTWLPLASYEIFYDAMGLDEAETRVVEAPWFLRHAGASVQAGLANAEEEEEEDEEATRVIEALADWPSQRATIRDPIPGGVRPCSVVPRPDSAVPRANKLIPPPVAPYSAEAKAALKPPPAWNPGGSRAAAGAPVAAAAHTPTPPPTAEPAASADRSLYDADLDDEADTPELGLSSSQQPSTLYDADDDEFEGEQISGMSRPPLPAAGMPPPPISTAPPPAKPGEKASPKADSESPVERRSANGGSSSPPDSVPVRGRTGARGEAPRERPSARPLWRVVSTRPGRAKPDRSDEQTAPALRHIREINTSRAQALVVLSVALALSLVAIIVLLLRG